MNKKAVEWLYQQLPELVAKGVIPAESADLIRKYYGPNDASAPGRNALTVFSIIGAILVGLGIILILAHNWDQLDRGVRLFIAVGMLLAAQVLAGVTIWRNKEHSVWTEAVAVFLMLMLGASIALVGQTYHIVDDVGAYLLTWMLLSFPIMYLMQATAPAVLYLAGVTAWVTTDVGGMGKQLVWVLLALAIPHYRRLLHAGRYANASVVFSWVLTLCVYFCFGMAFDPYIRTLGSLIYAALFAATLMIGLIWFDDSVKNWQKPFQVIGLAGCAGLAFGLTFTAYWKYLGRQYLPKTEEYVLAGLLLALVIYLGVVLVRQRRSRHLAFGMLPLVVGIGYLMQFFDPGGIGAAVLLNLYLLGISISIILSGLRENSIGVLNTGMLMLTFLIAARFLDANFSFVVRGLVFVILGVCFLTANLLLVRRKSGVKK